MVKWKNTQRGPFCRGIGFAVLAALLLCAVTVQASLPDTSLSAEKRETPQNSCAALCSIDSEPVRLAVFYSRERASRPDSCQLSGVSLADRPDGKGWLIAVKFSVQEAGGMRVNRADYYDYDKNGGNITPRA